jgi:hypothetical protein
MFAAAAAAATMEGGGFQGVPPRREARREWVDAAEVVVEPVLLEDRVARIGIEGFGDEDGVGEVKEEVDEFGRAVLNGLAFGAQARIIFGQRCQKVGLGERRVRQRVLRRTFGKLDDSEAGLNAPPLLASLANRSLKLILSPFDPTSTGLGEDEATTPPPPNLSDLTDLTLLTLFIDRMLRVSSNRSPASSASASTSDPSSSRPLSPSSSDPISSSPSSSSNDLLPSLDS